MTHPAFPRPVFTLFCVLLLALSSASAQQVYNGTAADGSLYQFVTPTSNWNHQLVLYAHGIVDPQLPISLPTDPGFGTFRDALVQQGFAVGYSSYSSNGFAVEDGIRDTDALLGTFEKLTGATPAKTFLIGLSLGSAVVLQMAERTPEHYSGVLPMCGFNGGSPLEVRYVGNARVLFDYFFPGVIPGTLLHTPLLPYDPTSTEPNVGQAVAAVLIAGLDPITSPNLPTLQLADSLGIEAATPTEVLAGLVEVLGFDVRYVNDLLARTKQASPYDNRFVYYHGSLNDKALNAGVERVAGTMEGLDYLLAYYQPTGRIQLPTVTLHTTRDPLVPYWHEYVYHLLATLQHRDNLLVQQSVNRFGHCEFEASEVEHAFAGLVGWVDYGIKPAGGDVTAVN